MTFDFVIVPGNDVCFSSSCAGRCQALLPVFFFRFYSVFLLYFSFPVFPCLSLRRQNHLPFPFGGIFSPGLSFSSLSFVAFLFSCLLSSSHGSLIFLAHCASPPFLFLSSLLPFPLFSVLSLPLVPSSAWPWFSATTSLTRGSGMTPPPPLPPPHPPVMRSVVL